MSGASASAKTLQIVAPGDSLTAGLGLPASQSFADHIAITDTDEAAFVADVSVARYVPKMSVFLASERSSKRA